MAVGYVGIVTGELQPKSEDLECYELWLLEPKHSRAYKPDYVDAIHLARMFGQDPRVVYQEWDQLWINRIQLVQDAEHQAAIARTQQKIDDAKKE